MDQDRNHAFHLQSSVTANSCSAHDLQTRSFSWSRSPLLSNVLSSRSAMRARMSFSAREHFLDSLPPVMMYPTGRQRPVWRGVPTDNPRPWGMSTHVMITPVEHATALTKQNHPRSVNAPQRPVSLVLMKDSSKP